MIRGFFVCAFVASALIGWVRLCVQRCPVSRAVDALVAVGRKVAIRFAQATLAHMARGLAIRVDAVPMRVETRAVGRSLVSLVAVRRDVAVRVAEPYAAHMAERHAVRVADACMSGARTHSAAVATAIATTAPTTIAAAMCVCRDRGARQQAGCGHNDRLCFSHRCLPWDSLLMR
jgi:hypothetical protein